MQFTKKHKLSVPHFIANFSVLIKKLDLEAKNLNYLCKIFEKFAVDHRSTNICLKQPHSRPPVRNLYHHKTISQVKRRSTKT